VKTATTIVQNEAAASPAVKLQPDAEYRTLLRLAELTRGSKPRRPEEALQQVVDLAREMTNARYAALGVSDENDMTEGFVTSGLTKAQLRGLKVPPQGHGPLGSLRSDGKPVRIDDLDADEKAFGFPPKHPTMKTMLGVPIWADGEVRGSLYVTDRDGGNPFTDDDVAVLLTLARHAGIVVERQWY
jgi:two-component system, NarL family, sensor histidine kinase DevS